MTLLERSEKGKTDPRASGKSSSDHKPLSEKHNYLFPPNAPAQVQPVVSDLFSDISNVDDQLGRFSDYEGGGRNSPTLYLWQLGKERFEKRCEEAIYLHGKAIKLWKKASRLNNSR